MCYIKDMDDIAFMTEEEYVSRMETGALLNPRVDSTFKAMFTQPTQESRDALHSFLEAAIEQKIKTVQLTASDAPMAFSGQRQVSYDIVCELDDGKSVNIEMQAFNQKYDYGKRAEYQVSRLETTYLKKGDGWEKAPVVYQITVLDFIYNKESSDAVSRYAMRTKSGLELSNSLNVVFVELPKVENLEQRLDKNTLLENWALFLKDADDPRKRDIIRRLTDKEAGLMQAQKSLSSISADKDLWIAQFRQEIFERDRISSLSAMRKEGLEAGRAIGLAEGRKVGLAEGREVGLAEGRAAGLAEGRKEKAVETARTLLSMGTLTKGQIAQATGLSVEEVEAL